MSFEWQTEEESRWEETNSTEDAGQQKPGRRWPWLILLLVVALVGLFFGWRTVQERVDEATELVEGDVLSSHQLAQRAARDRDQELFVTLLSGRNQSWTEAQKERLEQGLLFADTTRLFGWQPVAQESAESEVTLNADLTEAVLMAEESFVVRTAADVTQTVTLSQTAVYRQGSQRWLFSPPESEFWGEWQTESGELLRVVYPERDEALVLRLAEDIDAVLEELCLTLVTCPPRLTMRLRLETEPRSILLAAQPEAILSAGNELTLPAPTLVGYPTDEASYEALLRGYAGLVVTGMLLDTADYDCCDHVVFQQAILAMQLAELGLRPQPVTPDDYVQLVDTRLSLDRLASLWDSVTPVADADAVPTEVYTYLEFLRQQATTPDDVLREFQLAVANELQFYYLGRFTGYEPGSSGALEEAWQRFSRQQLLQAQEASSLPEGLSLPGQDLVALCGNETDMMNMDVYRYRFQEGVWQSELTTGYDFGLLAVTPDDNGYFITGSKPTDDADENIETWLKWNGSEPILVGNDEMGAYVVFPWNPTNPEDQRMFAWVMDEEDGNVPVSALIDPQQCSAAGCPRERVTGLPAWSPDGSAVLYGALDEPRVYLQRSGQTSMEQIGDSSYMAWLDNENFLLVRPDFRRRGQALVVASVDDTEGHELVHTDTLNQAIPSDSPVSYPLSIVWAAPDPSDANQILLAVSLEPPAWESHIFAVTRPAGTSWLDAEPELRWLQSVPGVVPEAWFMQHDQYSTGRWLTLPLQSGDSERNGLLIYDLRDKKTALVSPVGTGDFFLARVGDWSSDGQWFARTVAGAVDLIAPDFERGGNPVRYVIPHDLGNCYTVGWVNP